MSYNACKGLSPTSFYFLESFFFFKFVVRERGIRRDHLHMVSVSNTRVFSIKCSSCLIKGTMGLKFISIIIYLCLMQN
jgi:hypothetical protein